MSFGLFCIIPQPVHLWDKKAVNLVLPCFPLVGVVIGIFWWGVSKILFLFDIHIIFTSAVLSLIPFVISGFLHLDGYMDTSDAVLSRRPIEEKLKILKDPHVGAFGVIMLAVLFLLQFAFMYIVIENDRHIVMLIVIPVISRCCAALSIFCLKIIPQSSYANMLKENTGALHKIFVTFITILCVALLFYISGITGFIVFLSAIAGFTLAITWTYRSLKGISGDLAGFALVISELCALAAMALM